MVDKRGYDVRNGVRVSSNGTCERTGYRDRACCRYDTDGPDAGSRSGRSCYSECKIVVQCPHIHIPRQGHHIVDRKSHRRSHPNSRYGVGCDLCDGGRDEQSSQ